MTDREHPSAVEPRTDPFGGKLVLVLLDNKHGPSLKGGRSLWGLQRDLTYRRETPAETITVRAGFPTDLASIPRWAWMILPPDGPWVKAAIVHDYLYATSGTGVWKGKGPAVTRGTPYSRAEADLILREAMAARGVGSLRRNIIYWAVRVGGAGGWGQEDQTRRRGTADEAYAVD